MGGGRSSLTFWMSFWWLIFLMVPQECKLSVIQSQLHRDSGGGGGGGGGGVGESPGISPKTQLLIIPCQSKVLKTNPLHLLS